MTSLHSSYVIVLTLLTILLCGCQTGTYRLPLAQNNQQDIRIVIAEDAAGMTKLAAEDLQHHLAAMSGTTIPIQTEPDEAAHFTFFVGPSPATEALGLSVDDLHDGAYRWAAGDNWLALLGRDRPYQPPEIWAKHYGWMEHMYKQWDAASGGKWVSPIGQSIYRYYDGKHKLWGYDERGSLNAVCDFLRLQGVRWYMPGDLGTIIPQGQDVLIPSGSRVVHPEVGLRYQHHTRFAGAEWEDKLWYMRLGLNHYSRDIGYPLLQSHGMRDVTGRDEMKAAHPEYYALWGGKRQTERNKPCLSSQGLFEENVRFLRALFDIYDPPMGSVMPEDGYGSVCQCELCHDKGTPDRGYHGSMSDYVWTYANNVAKELYKTHPDKLISCFAYGSYLLPPTTIDKLSPNMVVGVVHGRSGNFRDPLTRSKVAEIRQQWQALSDHKLIIWEHYVFTHRGTIWPAYFPRGIADGFKAVHDISFGEVVETAIDQQRGGGLHVPGFNHLNVWVTARLYWDAEQDIDMLLGDYYQRYYGPAAAEMQAFIEASEATWRELANNPEQMTRLLDLFDQAKAAAPAGTPYAQRIALVDDYLNAMRDLRDQLARGRENVPEIRAMRRAGAELVLDGKLDDDVWQDLIAYPLRELQTGDEVAGRTTVRAYWDGPGPTKGDLVLGIRCQDPHMEQLRLPDGGANGFWMADLVEILIETQSHSYYQIAIAADGTMTDLDRKQGVIDNWASGASVATSRDADGWSIEVRLPATGGDRPDDPLHDIVGRAPSQSFPWYVNICRQRPREAHTEYSALSPTGEKNFHEIMKFAKLYVR